MGGQAIKAFEIHGVIFSAAAANNAKCEERLSNTIASPFWFEFEEADVKMDVSGEMFYFDVSYNQKKEQSAQNITLSYSVVQMDCFPAKKMSFPLRVLNVLFNERSEIMGQLRKLDPVLEDCATIVSVNQRK